MRIIVSEYSGACYGVQRALALVEDAARSSHPVCTLGPLIHNPKVVADLRGKGVRAVETVEEAQAGVLVIRSHGVGPQVIEAARARGLDLVDATCPHVLKAQKAARSLRDEGCLVIVVGEEGHPEVLSISAHAGPDALVVQSPENLPAQLPGRVGVVVQTTQSPAVLGSIVDALEARGIHPQIHDTICSATRSRQQAAALLSQEVDCMLVVGGYNSGNTTRLFEICKSLCPNTHHIESPDEIKPEWFNVGDAVGITAGASTPQEQITAVARALERL
jgi:4-hydroxy-3-methylbut-2-enyl diphosphate reductase